MTAPVSIASELRRVHDEIAQDDAEFATVSNNNVVIVASGRTDPSRLQTIISAFTQAKPSRFFVVQADEGVDGIDASVSAMCHSLGGHHKVCSEIIRLNISRGKIPALPSLLQAHLLPARQTELYIADSAAAEEFIEILENCSDIVYLDSSLFERGPGAVLDICRRVPRVVDIAWLRLGPWREAVKLAFDRGPFRERLAELRRIRISYEASRDANSGAAASLLAGWFISRLDAQVKKAGSSTIECVLPGSKSLTIELDGVTDRGPPGIRQVYIEFGAPGGVSLTIPQDDSARKVLSLGVRDGSEETLLSKHFLVGDSVLNYGQSLSRAASLHPS